VRQIKICQRIITLWIALLLVQPLIAQEAELHLGEYYGPLELYQYVDYLRNQVFTCENLIVCSGADDDMGGAIIF